MKKGLLTVVLLVAVVAGLYFANQKFDPERRTDQQIAAAESAQEDLKKADQLEAGLKDAAATQVAGVQEAVDVSDQEIVKIKFETTKGDFIMELHRDWAPLGVQQVIDGVNDGVYNDARFFRVIPGFMVQFGIPGDPKLAAKWNEKNIQDDPVKESNTRGMVTFAMGGPNTRSSQLFINFTDNKRLDSMGFSPIGKVIEGMEVVDKLESKYGSQLDAPGVQPMIQQQGNAFLDKTFPGLDSIKKATILKGE